MKKVSPKPVAYVVDWHCSECNIPMTCIGRCFVTDTFWHECSKCKKTDRLSRRFPYYTKDKDGDPYG